MNKLQGRAQLSELSPQPRVQWSAGKDAETLTGTPTIVFPKQLKASEQKKPKKAPSATPKASAEMLPTPPQHDATAAMEAKRSKKAAKKAARDAAAQAAQAASANESRKLERKANKKAIKQKETSAQAAATAQLAADAAAVKASISSNNNAQRACTPLAS